MANLIPIAVRNGVTQEKSQMAAPIERTRSHAIAWLGKGKRYALHFSNNRSCGILKIDI